MSIDEHKRLVRRIQPTFHCRWHVESRCCPIRQDELPGKEGGRPAGQRDDEDILRHVRRIDHDSGSDFHARQCGEGIAHQNDIIL